MRSVKAFYSVVTSLITISLHTKQLYRFVYVRVVFCRVWSDSLASHDHDEKKQGSEQNGAIVHSRLATLPLLRKRCMSMKGFHEIIEIGYQAANPPKQENVIQSAPSTRITLAISVRGSPNDTAAHTTVSTRYEVPALASSKLLYVCPI